MLKESMKEVRFSTNRCEVEDCKIWNICKIWIRDRTGRKEIQVYHSGKHGGGSDLKIEPRGQLKKIEESVKTVRNVMEAE